MLHKVFAFKKVKNFKINFFNDYSEYFLKIILICVVDRQQQKGIVHYARRTPPIWPTMLFRFEFLSGQSVFICYVCKGGHIKKTSNILKS